MNKPQLPVVAQTNSTESAVVLDATIDADGKVIAVQRVSGDSQLAGAAIAAVKEWKYDSAQLDSEPTPGHRVVRITFSFKNGAER